MPFEFTTDSTECPVRGFCRVVRAVAAMHGLCDRLVVTGVRGVVLDRLLDEAEAVCREFPVARRLADRFRSFGP